MQKVYEHPEGDLVIELSNRQMEFCLRAVTKPGITTTDHVAFAPAFNVAGQGANIEDARESLKSVLTDYLDAFNIRNRLQEAFRTPWQESQKDETEIAALQKALRRKSRETIHLVLSNLAT